MKSVLELAKEIVSREGGYVNDKDDLGGATKYGVTLGTLRRLGADINHDGRIDIADVKGLTQEKAVEIYVKHYFNEPKIDMLPVPLQPPVFDMYANAGSNGVKILQRMLNTLGFPCSDDGAIGVKTAAAAHAAAKKFPGNIADLYGAARREYYYGIADVRPANRKYARRIDGGKGGWITRAEEFMSTGSHLTDAEHRARVSKWA